MEKLNFYLFYWFRRHWSRGIRSEFDGNKKTFYMEVFCYEEINSIGVKLGNCCDYGFSIWA